MRMRFEILAFVFLLFLVPLKSRAQSFFPTSTDPLTQAHQSFLTGDFKAMAVNLKQAIEQHPNDSVVKDNVLSLLKKARESADEGIIPVDWRLPDEIKSMNVGVKYSFKDEGAYTFRVYGMTVHDKAITQMQVIQFPDHVVLDKQAGIGDWNDLSQIDTMNHVYELQTKKSRQTISSGLYLLNFTLNDGTQTKGWFILEDDVNSTANPRITVPATDQVFNMGNPTMSWQNFTSPQYQPYEKRSFWVGISRSEPPHYDWDEVWGHYEIPPVSEQITIDSQGDEGSLPKLNKGSYIFFIDYHERRKFGDLNMTRDSLTTRNFKISQ